MEILTDIDLTAKLVLLLNKLISYKMKSNTLILTCILIPMQILECFECEYLSLMTFNPFYLMQLF